MSIEIKDIKDVWYASPSCSCCTYKADIVVIFTKEVMNNKENLISLCSSCYKNLKDKIGGKNNVEM